MCSEYERYPRRTLPVTGGPPPRTGGFALSQIESDMYENTIFEPIYGNSDLGSITVAIFIVAVCVGASLALGHVANLVGGDKT